MPLYALGDISPKLPEEFHWIAPTAIIIGDVELKANASVWFGTTIRGDNEPIIIGENSNVQENCVLHTDPGCPLSIGENCTIGHKAMLHGCTIGNNSLIGMGATILNAVNIGDNCLIGAGALIPERKVIPDNSLVMGVPGKVVKTLDSQAVAGLKLSAEHYVANAKRFSTDLNEIK